MRLSHFDNIKDLQAGLDEESDLFCKLCEIQQEDDNFDAINCWVEEKFADLKLNNEEN